MKNRKTGLRMCIISIVMIMLCIPNQIQIAKAEENVGEIVVRDKKVVWDKDTELDLFPKEKFPKFIAPGDSYDYTFYVENKMGSKIECQIRIEEDILATKGKYPIEYQLYNRKDPNTNLLGDGWENPKDSLGSTVVGTEKIENEETEEYILRWRFKEVDRTFVEENAEYRVNLSVEARPVTDTDNDTPNNPSDDNKKDDNNNSNNNVNNGNNNGSNSNGSQNGNNNTSNNNKGNNTNNGNDDSKGNDSSNNNQGNSQNNNQDNLNIDKTSNKGTGSTTNKKKVNTSDITTPVIYVALMILTFGLILLVRGRKENS